MDTEQLDPSSATDSRQAYNVMTDMVTGVNVRKRDNLWQALVIAVSLVIGGVIGAIAIADRAAGAIVGGFFGLLAGFFGSGIYLMVYRGIQHLRGKHD